MFARILHQLSQFHQAWPERGSVAYRLAGIRFDLQFFFDRLMGKEPQPPAEDDEV